MQTFNLAGDYRLQVDVGNYPPLEELQDAYSGEENITIVQLDGADSKFHTQNNLLRTELEKEATSILRSLKVQEWERSRKLIERNHLYAIDAWKQRQETFVTKFRDVPIPNPIAKCVDMVPVSRFERKIALVANDEQNSDIHNASSAEGSISSRDSAMVIRQTIFTPRTVDISKEKIRFRLKHSVPNDVFSVLSGISTPELPRITKGDVNSTQHLTSNALESNNKRPGNQNIVSVFNSRIPKFDPIPHSCTWITIKFNVHAEDETILRALPYFGDDDFTGVDVSDFEKVPGELEPEICGEAEELMVSYMLDRHKRSQGTKPEVFSALENVLHISISEISKAYQRVVEGDWYRKTVVKKYGWIEESGEDKVEYKRLQAYDVHGDLPLLDLVSNEIPSLNPDLSHNVQTGIGTGLGLSNKAHYEDIVANYRDFFCRRCLRYACLLHRIQQPLPRQRVDPKPPFPAKVGKYILPTDLVRDHRRPVSVLADISKTRLFSMKGGELVEPSVLTKGSHKGKCKEPGANTRSSSTSAVEFSSSQPLENGISHRSSYYRPTNNIASYEGALYYNPFEDRVPKDEINPDNFYFADFSMVYMSPITKYDEIFVPSTTLANFPTLLNTINNSTNGKITQDSHDGQHEDSPSANSTDDKEKESLNLQDIQPPQLFQNATSSKDIVVTLFKSRLPAHSVDVGNSNKMLGHRSGKGSSFVAVTSGSIVDKCKPIIVTEKQMIKHSFEPPLTDAEISLAVRLCHMFAFYKPLEVSPFGGINQGDGGSPGHSAIASPSSSACGRKNYYPTDLLLVKDVPLLDSLIDFLYNTLATRTKDEIRQIIEHRRILFPAPSSEDEENGNTETIVDSKSSFDNSNNLLVEEEDLAILSDIDEDDDQGGGEDDDAAKNMKDGNENMFGHGLEIDAMDSCDQGSNTHAMSSNNSTCTGSSSATKGSRPKKRKFALDDCDYESVARELRGDSVSGDTMMETFEIDIDDPFVDMTTMKTSISMRDDEDQFHQIMQQTITKAKSASGPPKPIPKIKKNSFQRAFEPCDHDGPCTNCVCLQNGTFCEKYCGCSDDCRNKFPGCVCRGGCKSKNCPCLAASRVCDPDLCGECGAAIPIVLLPLVKRYMEAKSKNLCFSSTSSLTNGSTQTSKRGSNLKVEADATEHDGLQLRPLCTNLALQYRQQKKLYIGRSQIHGWGAYAGEDIERNDFISEYTGEVISQEEADRRGNVYDKLNMSYLFTINDDQVVDATRKGNFAKFINHNKENPNCFVRILQVESDHKIGIFANKPIKMGEELTFDYNYLTVTAPDWAHSKRSSSASTKLFSSSKRSKKRK